jgi:uncharacterized protein (DUF1778 family)
MATNREKVIQIRVRKDEYRCIWDKARSQNQTISEFIRNLAMEACKK